MCPVYVWLKRRNKSGVRCPQIAPPGVPWTLHIMQCIYDRNFWGFMRYSEHGFPSGCCWGKGCQRKTVQCAVMQMCWVCFISLSFVFTRTFYESGEGKREGWTMPSPSAIIALMTFDHQRAKGGRLTNNKY